MPARLHSSNTLLERLAQNLEDMAPELGPFIQEEHTLVGQRHLARQWTTASHHRRLSALS